MTPEWAGIIITSIVAITVAVIKFIPRKGNPGLNKFVTKELFDQRMKYVEKTMDEMKADIAKLQNTRGD